MGQEVMGHNGLSREIHKSAATMTTHARRVYSKDFLLSVGELEHCKKVPTGLDSVLLRGTQSKLDDGGVAIPGAPSRGLIRTTRENDAHSESPPDLPEWRRPSSLPGSPFLKQGPRQAEPNISSPRPGPARGGNNPAQSIMGRSGSARWELRSSGDRDKNRTQYEWESSTPTESGGRLHGRGFGRSALVVSQEHDGLLGSGGPIVHRGMMQTPMAADRHRAERTSRTGRTGEQYHSARGGKMSRNAQIRREDTDTVSDETFGSDDWPNGERSEHERQRRDRFEQMRKELRKKPLNTARNHNDNWLGEGVQGTETILSSSPGTPQSSSSKDDISKPHNKPAATSSTPRLLVPPGFSKPTLPKTGSPKENNEASKSYLFHTKDEDMHVMKQTVSTDGVKLDKQEHLSSLFLKIDQFEDKNQKTSSPLQSPVMSKFARWFPSQGSSIKESDLNSDDQAMHLVTKSEDLPLLRTSSPVIPELAGGSEDTVVSKLKSVASLMPVNNKGSILPMPVGPSLEDVEKVMTAGTDLAGVVGLREDRVSERKNCVMVEDLFFSDGDPAIMCDAAQRTEVLYPQRPSSKDVPEKILPRNFMTCEDLEQSLLAETVHTVNHPKLKDTQHDTDQNINLMQLLHMGVNRTEDKSITQQGWNVEQAAGKVIDGSASFHIMSLLQKKTADAGNASPLADLTSAVSAEASVDVSGHDQRVEDARKKETQCNSTEIISLETLFGKVFGKGFVNELRTVGEPVSSKQLVDDSDPIGKDSALLDVVLTSSQSAKRSGHGDGAFIEEAGWGYDRQHKESKESETTQSSDLQNDFWSDMSPHAHAPTKSSRNFSYARGLSMNGSPFSDLRQPKPSPHLPHQGNFSHGQHHEGLHFPTSDVHPHRMPFEPVQEPHFIHDNALYGMGMYPPNSPFHPFHEGFLRASNHVPGHYEDHSSVVGGVYRMPSAFPSEFSESVQMGFNPSQGVSDPRIGGSRINAPADRWFTGDHLQASQGLAGFNPFQHQVPSMIQERKSGYVVSGIGVGPGVKNHNAGLPLDKRVHAEIAQLPFTPGLDPYMLSGTRPDYG